MANSKHLAILKQGVKVWNQWRKDKPDIQPNLRNASLKNLNLASINFSDTDLRGTKFNNTIFVNANFSGARIGLHSELFLFVFLSIICIAIYFYRFSFLFAFTVYLFVLLLCILRNFTANNKPYLPHNEKLVSKSEKKLWEFYNINDHLNRKEWISGLKTSINHLIHVSLFNFIPLLFIAASLEPKLRIFSDNGMHDTLIFFSAIIAFFYLGFLGTIGFDINKILRWLFFSIVPTSTFYNADLTDADLSFAQLTNSNFRKAIMLRTNFYKVKGIKQIEISPEYLYILKPLILNLILYRDAKNIDLEEVNLSNLNLSKTNFADSNLKHTQLTNSNLAGSTLTGACIEDWNINSKTNLDNLICNHIYLKQNQQERRPHNPDQVFARGEFSQLFKQVVETVDLVFSDGISWQAFLHSFQKLQIECNSEELAIQAIERKSDNAFVIRVEVPPDANKAEIEKYIHKQYQIKLKSLEENYKLQLNAKDEQIINIYRQQNTNLLEIIKLKASQPVNLNNFMSNINQSHSGNGDNVGGDKNTTNIYNSQDLNQTAADIQALLEQLEQTYNPNTTTGKMTIASKAIEHIENDNNLAKRIISALEKGGISYLQARIINPAASFFIAALEDWQKNKQ